MLVRNARAELGEPNSWNKRLIQKWEAGDHASCWPNYRRALSRVTGMSDAQLCEPLRRATGTSASVDGVALRALLDEVIGQLAQIRERLGGAAQ